MLPHPIRRLYQGIQNDFNSCDGDPPNLKVKMFHNWFRSTMTIKPPLSTKQSPTPRSSKYGGFSRRDAMLGAAAAVVVSFTNVRASPSDQLIVVDGWVVKQSELLT